MAQVLTGVNRAFPFADTSDPTFERQIDTLFRVNHSANFNTAVQALMLLQQISAAKNYGADRYYRTLYESILDPRLIGSSKQVLYLNLLYKSLKADLNAERVQAFIKRLLQTITMHEVSFVCGVLYLVSELEGTFPSIKTMITQPEYPGGTVLEITRGSTRKIELVNDPGPVSGTGATITNVALPRAEMIGLLSTEYGK